MVGENGALGSRVRVSEGTIAAGTSFSFMEPVTLAPLSTPRTSSTEFYLKRPVGREGLWNFDYLLKPKDRARRGSIKDPTRYKDMDGSGIAGRKVYLHYPFDLHRQYDDSRLDANGQFKRDGQNVTVRPLSEGTFHFDVFFEGISESELALLAYAIGGMGEGRLQKLGHGRPLGMGSVRVRVDSIETRDYAFEGGTLTLVEGTLDDAWVQERLPNDERSVARRRLITLLARNLQEVPYAAGGNLGGQVSYPKPYEGKIGEQIGFDDWRGRPRAEENATFGWFKKNRGRTVQCPIIENTLGIFSVEEMMKGPDKDAYPQ